MNKPQNIRTPLGKVRGLGSAKDGTHHWWMQRVTALAMIPLAIWLMAHVARLSFADATTLATWMADPIQALLMALFIGTMAYHAKLGVQVIIEDYVHCACGKTTLLLLNALGFIVVGAMGLMAVFALHTM